MRYQTYDFRHAESILNGNQRRKREILAILESLDFPAVSPYCRRDPLGPHRMIQRAFQRHHWAVEVPVCPRSARRQRFDIYKDRIAIKIELSNRERLYRDYFRFVRAEKEGRIDVGVIIVPNESADPRNGRNGVPHLGDVVEDLTSLRSSIPVPIWVIALG